MRERVRSRARAMIPAEKMTPSRRGRYSVHACTKYHFLGEMAGLVARNDTPCTKYNFLSEAALFVDGHEFRCGRQCLRRQGPEPGMQESCDAGTRSRDRPRGCFFEQPARLPCRSGRAWAIARANKENLQMTT